MATNKKHVAQDSEAEQQALCQYPGDEEPWKAYWQRKQLFRQNLRRTYLKLSMFTLLFGLLTITLRLDMRFSGAQSWYKLQQWLQNLWLGKTLSSEPDKLELEKLFRESQPSLTQLKTLETRVLSPQMLQLAEETWGSSRILVGSSEELELRHFPLNSIYLLRKRSDRRVIYVGQKAP